MKETLESISDFTKFLILLVMYTGYLTWWASSVSSNLENNSEHIMQNTQLIAEHSKIDFENTKQTIKLVDRVGDLSKKVETHDQILSSIVEQHIKCSILLEQVMQKLNINHHE